MNVVFKFSNVLKNYLFFLSDAKVRLLFVTCKYICKYFQTIFTSTRKNYFVKSGFCLPLSLHYKGTNNIYIYKYICKIFLRNLCF